MAASSATTARLSSLGAETVLAWTELNQRIGQDMMRITFAAWRDAQTAVSRWHALLNAR